MFSLGKLSGVQGRIFEEDDLQLLLQLVRRAAAKWKQLGLALGFRKSELDEIEATVLHAAGGPEAYLTELLSRWLDWAPPKHRLPSSHTLAEALRSETVQKERVAYRLEQYFSEDTGTQDVDTEKSPSPPKASASSLPHYDTQLTVMPTPKPRSTLFIPEKYLQFFAEYDWDSRAPLVQRYLKLAESVKEALNKRGITAEAIGKVLWENDKAKSRAYMDSVLQQAHDIQKASDVHEVLAAVTTPSSFPDYKPLEHLIKMFNLKEVEEELERYKKDLQQFLLLMMEAPPDTDPPPRKKSRVGPDPEVRREHCTTT